MNNSIPNRKNFRKEYEEYLPARNIVLKNLEAQLTDLVSPFPSLPGVKGRVKDFSSYFKKYLKVLKHHPAAPPEITDLIGIRIVCPFIEDIQTVETLVKEHFKVIEVERKGPKHSFREFGYESIHLLIEIPEEMKEGDCNCSAAELQIRTILQDAWAEVEHELVYKAEFTPFDEPMKRKLAAVNASLTLADIIFQEIRTYQRQLNGELSKRRESFFRKIESAADSFLFEEEAESSGEEQAGGELGPEAAALGTGSFAGSAASMDDLLLSALSAHNHGRFDQAAGFYSRLLELNPAPEVCALVYKHRGMAHFACSRYEEAISDFRRALDIDPVAYKAAYYQGVVESVLSHYSEAIEAFDRSLEIYPYQPYCLYRRGQAWYHLEDYPQALSDCEAALTLEPFEAAKKLRALLLKKLKM